MKKMLEEGTVLEIRDDKKAVVELERKPACGLCCACSPGAAKMKIEADNSVGAKAGDKVRLDVEAKGIVLGIIMLYLLPALGLVFGIVVGKSILMAIILMFLFFIVARFYGRKKISYAAEIVEVVK